MTPRRAGILLKADRPRAILAVAVLAIAWASDARAGCAGRAHSIADASATASLLSPEIVGDAPALPERSGCTGAFCSKPSGPSGVDVTTRIDLRADSWARVDLLAARDRDGGALLLSRSDVPRPRIGWDELVDPPR